MAETKEFQRAQYPLPAYNFRVVIEGVTMSFSEVSGLTVEYETVTYKHGLSFWEGEKIKKFHMDKYAPVTLKKGIVKGFDYLQKWLEDKESRTLAISLCDELGKPLVTWHVKKSMPVKLEAPAFDANTNEVAVESLEVMASGISVEHH